MLTRIKEILKQFQKAQVIHFLPFTQNEMNDTVTSEFIFKCSLTASSKMLTCKIIVKLSFDEGSGFCILYMFGF